MTPYRGQRLTDHEIEILTAVAYGHTDRRMTIKLGAVNRANMVALGFVNGYLRLPIQVLEGVR